MTPQGFAVSYSAFRNLHPSNDGGALSLITKQSLFINYVTFYDCTVASQYKGGCIFLNSSAGAYIRAIHANKCSAFTGFCTYITSPDAVPDTEMNQSVIISCKGENHASCAFYHNNVNSRNINMTDCQTKKAATNFHLWYSYKSSGAFFNFYKNKNDILYGIDGTTADNKLSYAHIISNNYSLKSYGYIHTYFDNKCELTIDNICI